MWEYPILGALLLIFFFVFYGARLGKRILPRYHNIWQTSFGSLTILSLIMILGTAVYYIAFLPNELWTLFVLLTPVAVWLATPKHKTFFKIKIWHEHFHKLDRSSLSLATISIVLLLALFAVISNTEIFDAVRSTWERIPSIVLWLSALLFGTLSVMAIHGRERSLTLPLVMFTSFFTLSIAAIVYPLGFGFDSFLHQATEMHIAEFETIDPKPFYYIGQYVSVLFASKAFALPLLLVDRFILTILAAIFVPLAWYFGASHLSENKRSAMFSTLGVFLVPLSSLIVTTPQGLANLLTLLLILLSIPLLLNKKRGLPIWCLWLIGIATAAIHPLAGIPALLYLLLLTLRTQPPFLRKLSWSTKLLKAIGDKFREPAVRNLVDNRPPAPIRFLFWLVAILGSVSLPIVFIVNALVSGLDTSFSFAALSPVRLVEGMNFNLIFQSGYNTFLDFVYLYGANVLLLFVLTSVFVLWRYKKQVRESLLALPAIMAVILFINYIVMSAAIDFTFLINYERSNYSDRLIVLIFFFLTPYLALFLVWLWNKLENKSVLSKSFVLLILVGMMTSQFYLTYPRRDNYDTSRGFNTGTADMLAVDYIEEHAPDDYIVLANQQVAAAAVFRHGFKKYYGDTFYYPIPTGGELYQIFLEMNERPSRELMQEAMKLADVNTAYYVVNDYWWQSERLVETAKLEANDWIAIDDGRVHVFRYNYIELR